jgi:Ca-activated chloride channel family protein
MAVLDADAILKALSERMMANYDLTTAMEKLKWDGLVDLQEERIDGLDKMLEQIKELKNDLLNTYTLDHILDKIKDDLKLIFEEETSRLSLEKIKDDKEQKEKRLQIQNEISEVSHWLETEFPKNLAQRLRKLKGIFAEENSATHKIVLINQDIWRKISGLNLLLIQKDSTLNENELTAALTQLKELIDSGDEEQATDFVTYMAQYSHIFNFKSTARDWIEKIQKKKTALKQLFLCAPYSIRLTFEDMLDRQLKIDNLAQALQSIWNALDKKIPTVNLKGHHFSGNRSLDIDSALVMVERINKLVELEDAIVKVKIHGNLSEINRELLREILGELAENSLQNLSQMMDILIENGYLNVAEHGYKLTSKALRKISALALSDIFSNFHWSKSNKIAIRKNRPVHSFTGETKEYEYGDVLNLHLTSTIFNALRRNSSPDFPIPISPLDFDILIPEYFSQNSTVLLIDMSSSMDDKFAKAKKVALALEHLIHQYFPSDHLKVVGFYSLAKLIDIGELIELKPMSFFVGNVPKMIEYDELKKKERKGGLDFPGDLTNIQEGIRLSRELLMRDRNEEKHIFLITDGEPTVCIREGVVYLENEPTAEIFEETLKEVKKCTRQGIKITTFMLSENQLLIDFVKKMEEINKGKAFFTPSEEIDQYVVIDYLRKKSYQIE